MSQELKLRRGTATEHNTFTGANGEVSFNTTKETLHTHDGETLGGAPSSEVVVLESIKELNTLPPGFLREDRQYSVKSFWPGLNLGGGIFSWNPARPKADHNGGTVVDPDKISELGLPTDPDPFGTYFTATAGIETGCFELLASKFEDFEIFGAVEGGAVDNTGPWSGYIKSNQLGLYFSTGDYLIAGNMPEKSGMMLRGMGSQNTRIISDLPNQYIFGQNTGPEKITGVTIVGMTIQGDPTEGSTDSLNVARGVGVRGWSGFYFDDVEFNTFTLAGCYMSRLPGDWIQVGDYNSQDSVDALIALNSEDGVFNNCKFKNIISSAGLSVFGGSRITVDRGVFQNTGLVNILFDSASTTTRLEDYNINTDINITNTVGDGTAGFTTVSTGSVTNCNFKKVSFRSYDFDQQLNSVPDSPSYTGQPFLTLNYVKRGFIIHGNTLGEIDIRCNPTAVKCNNNTITSTENNQAYLLRLGNNGISWPDTNDYWDSKDPLVPSTESVDCDGNTYVCEHTGVTAIRYYDSQPQANASLMGSSFNEEVTAFATKILRPGASRWVHSELDLLRTRTRIEVASTGPTSSVLSRGLYDTTGIYSPASTVSWFGAGYNPETDTVGNSDLYAGGMYFNKSNGRWRFAIGNGLGDIPVGRLEITRSSINPYDDNAYSCGTASNRFSVVYAGTGSISTSDKNAKQQIKDPETSALRAWGKVNFKQYKFNDAVGLKGDNARWHFGVIAQDVKDAFESEGLDPFAYGILCYDEWPDKHEYEEYDENGNGVGDMVLVQESGGRYGIRYDEALALECAYLRARLDGVL